MIKGVLLDYGGTIDTNGVHWGEVLWSAYCRYQIPVTKDIFRQAYSYAEKALAINPLVKPEHNFLDVLRIKLEQEFNFLYDNGHLQAGHIATKTISLIAHDCNAFAAASISNARPVLDNLAADYPLVLVSNFYGNIRAVLEGFGILHYFKQIIESAVVGIRKPDPEIFSRGVTALGLSPAECVVVGDSYIKDIVAGKKAGCSTVWLKGQGWEKDPGEPLFADCIIASFAALHEALAQPPFINSTCL